MTKRALPGLGIFGFWDLEADYKTEMDANMLSLSVLVQTVVKSKTTELPSSGVLGDVYIVPHTAVQNANLIAVWDGETGAEAWTYFTPKRGWGAFVDDVQTRVMFDGSAWVADVGAGSDLVDVLDAHFGNTNWRTGGSGGSQLPGISSSDNEKVLSVAEGAWVAKDLFAESSGDSNFTGLQNLTPTAGWGMLRRNPSYTGPALRVEDVSNPGTQADVGFDGNGRIRGPLPYGSNTRLIRVYDQWGDDDLVSSLANNVRLLSEDDANNLFTWQIDFSGTSSDASLASLKDHSSAAWAVDYPVALSVFKRVNTDALDLIWGVGTSTGSFMSLGIWQEGQDLHSRVNGGNASDWPNSGWSANPSETQTFQRTILDVSQRNGNAEFTFNGVQNGSVSVGGGGAVSGWSGNLNVGNWSILGDPFDGQFIELHLFSTTAAMTSAERQILDTAGQDYRVNAVGGVVGNPILLAMKEKLNRIPGGVSLQLESAAFSVSDAMLSGSIVKEVDSTSGPIAITIPPGLTGTEPLVLEQTGTNDVTFVAGAGVSVNSLNGNMKVSGQFGTVVLTPKGNNVFSLRGDLTA